MTELKLKGAALIIGSLYWQDDLDPTKKDGIRKSWRTERLTSKTLVAQVPIRYGRLSSGNVYTMVFSKEYEEKGFHGNAIVVPFKNEVFNSWEDIYKESGEMSLAEGMKGKFVGGNKIDWGVMTIILNKEKIGSDVTTFLSTKWKDAVTKHVERDRWRTYCLGDENPVLDSNYTLDIKWPNQKDSKNKNSELLDFDFLLCSATKPKNNTKSYPSIEDLAVSVQKDKNRYYFRNNNKHSISTSEDLAILKYLKKYK